MDYAGTAVFATSGAITAGSGGIDIVGGTVIGCITALGGGTFRDAILFNKVPFWIEEPEYFLLAASVALLTFLLWPKVPEQKLIKKNGGEGEAFFWLDAVSLGVHSPWSGR